MTQIDTSTDAVEALLKDVTPGPFIADSFCIDGEHECRIAMPDALGIPAATVAECFHNWNDGYAGERRISWKEAEANARFIAAARELVPALLAERDALAVEVVKLRAERNHANDVTDVAVEEIERIKAQAVTVKPLEWDDISYTVSEATSFDLKFHVRLGTDGIVRWQSKHMGDWVESPSFAAAKAAAQADYEARILSSITARTEDEVWNEAIEAAASTVAPPVTEQDSDRPEFFDAMDEVLDTRWHRIRALARPTKGETK